LDDDVGIISIHDIAIDRRNTLVLGRIAIFGNCLRLRYGLGLG